MRREQAMSNRLSLYSISEKLAQLSEDYGSIYPKFRKLELEYVKEFDRLLMIAQNTFTNQPSREAYARQEIAKLPIYEEFNNLSVEVRVIETQMRNLGQISRNLVSNNWQSEN